MITIYNKVNKRIFIQKEINKSAKNKSIMVSLSPNNFSCAACQLRVICTLHITVNSSFLKDEKDTRKITRGNGINSNNNYINITVNPPFIMEDGKDTRRITRDTDIDIDNDYINRKKKVLECLEGCRLLSGIVAADFRRRGRSPYQ